MYYINAQDVRTEGETPGCPGCRTAMGRGYDRKHTDVCVNRFEDILSEKGIQGSRY